MTMLLLSRYRPGLKEAISYLGASIKFIPKMFGELADLIGRKRGTDIGPSNFSVSDGPNLLDLSLNGFGVAPSFDDAASDGRTHSVNDQLLAEEYGRGLRVACRYSSGWRRLAFILEESENIMDPPNV